MSDPAVIVAQEIQDLAATVQEVASAIREKEQKVTVNVPEQLAPVVNVQVPDQPVPDVIVNVPQQTAPVVNVAPADVRIGSPIVNVAPNLPNAYEVLITDRDPNGYISRFVINQL